MDELQNQNNNDLIHCRYDNNNNNSNRLTAYLDLDNRLDDPLREPEVTMNLNEGSAQLLVHPLEEPEEDLFDYEVDTSFQDINTLEEHEFYTAAAKYWEHVPATVDGMLGGFGFISQIDIKGSTKFLKALFELENPPSKTFALDCGAGIGRITKNLLLNHFKHIDLVEQNLKFLEVAKTYLKNYSSRIQNYYPIGNIL
uniref:Alpha N-terminal protein methyltransferase 1 n=1 Tax=Apis cerana TaxID=7461 RepID=V9I7P0_APICE